MAKPKTENSKASAARDRKAGAKADKDSKEASAKEAAEAADWSKGAKKPGKAEDKEAKKAQLAAKKAELDALKKQEEAELAKIKPKKSGEDKKAAKKQTKIESQGPKAIPVSFAASNIDDAIDLFTAIDDSESNTVSKISSIDQHPERRAKAAYAAYEEKRLPILKEENKGLRLTQLKQLLWKEWQKSPENPFNQATLAYNATREDKRDLVESTRKDLETRLKI